MQKIMEKQKASFVSPLTKELQSQKATRKINNFCMRYLSKTKRKPVEREMFFYQFVAHMPNLRQIGAKIKNSPKFDSRLCSSGARSPQATNIWSRATEK